MHMAVGHRLGSQVVVGAFTLALLMAAGVAPRGLSAQAPAAPPEVTYTRDIAPILQRSCETCHRVNGVAPMSLSTYEETRPWARAIKQRTGIGPRAGVMPPWYVEREIGIQHFKNDPSLSEDEVALIAKWADSGAPRGNPGDMPPARVWNESTKWAIGEPDLVVRTEEILVKAGAPDWWGEIAPTPTGLTEDRYVSAVEVREVNDVDTSGSGRHTVGGRYVFHHMIWNTRPLDQEDSTDPNDPFNLAALTGASPGATTWPVHEVGREPDFFDPRAAPAAEGGFLHHLRLGAPALERPRHQVPLASASSCTRRATSRVPQHAARARQRARHRHQADGVQPAAARLPRARAAHQDRDLRAAPARARRPHVPRVHLGHQHPDAHLRRLRPQLGAQYEYDDDHAPLLPKGAILHIIGYMDNTEKNKNVPDPRNWQGSGNRSIANMFIDLGQSIALTEEQFLPRRNRFVFRVPVPAGFGEKDELVWTLATRGKSEKAYASLALDYKIDGVVRASETGALGAGSSSPEVRANKAPLLEVQGQKRVTARVGEQVTLSATVLDDGIPRTRAIGAGAAVSNTGSSSTLSAASREQLEALRARRVLLPPSRVTVGKIVGLHASWFVYRGSGRVSFDPPQIASWEDTRTGGNSPWAPLWTPPELPADGRVSVRATFHEPGEYIIRVRADDGALTTDGMVTVVVTP
jgi:hypothetical protein